MALPGVAREVSVTNANKPRRLWENREIFTGSAYGVIVVTGPTKTLVPAAVMGLVPRDRGAESELFLDCASLTSFHNFGEPGNGTVLGMHLGVWGRLTEICGLHGS